ncbi:hypothetical protein HMPREF0496_0760 [Lentilactobacillus hilgardii ATCC 27305]|nr:hypothetical protein HMPREF0496_0760 [Lentilactobacillus hilgardii ATCC 27305]
MCGINPWQAKTTPNKKAQRHQNSVLTLLGDIQLKMFKNLINHSR